MGNPPGGEVTTEISNCQPNSFLHLICFVDVWTLICSIACYDSLRFGCAVACWIEKTMSSGKKWRIFWKIYICNKNICDTAYREWKQLLCMCSWKSVYFEFQGETMSILWHKEDGSSDRLSPNASNFHKSLHCWIVSGMIQGKTSELSFWDLLKTMALVAFV